MTKPTPTATPRRRSIRIGLLASTLLSLAASPLLHAKDRIPNLGGGLEEMAAQAGARSLGPALRSAGPSLPQVESLITMDSSGRPLVQISMNGKMPGADTLQALQAMPGVEIVATDMGYRAGVVEAYVPPGMLVSIAKHGGVLAVVPSSPAVTNVGAVDSQGIVQHRVDQIEGVDGSGITIGIMSDSYDTSTNAIKEADDIATGDLPGPGNPFGNTEPVVIIEDFPGGSDEGRGMAQIVHDMAPKARLGFATANTGQVGFANNIRALAGFPDAIGSRPDFKADVIVDDIIYLAEPFFQDGIVAQAVDDVAAAGVSYFSSAGNRPATQAYDSHIRIVDGDPASWANTNLDFSAVNPDLYAGGFHNFVEQDGLDIAQTVAINPRGTLVFQWNEPFDPQPPTPIRDIASGSGSVPPAGFDPFTFDGTEGTLVEIFTDADPASANPISDSLFFVFAPDGTQIAFQDTGTNPESLVLELPQTGTYQVLVGDFNSLPGDYIYRVQEVEVVQQVLTDYNVLFFLTDGTFIGALQEDNRFTNRPIELGAINANITVQIVISRSNVPEGKKRAAADRLRYVWFTSGTPQEYFSYLGPVTYGHNSAAGAMGVAAYAFFAPYIPESFTSPGPSTIYFDTDNRRFHRPQIRKKPDMAAMDGANNTFFGGDSTADEDTFPNFFGTSAAAPHAAAIAALVLDAAGGPGSIKPNRMRRILQRSAFPHDLDPYFASGFAWKRGNALAITANADGNAISQFDPNVFSIWNVGRNPLESLSINGNGGNPTQTPKGIVFDERIGPGQPFVVGDSDGVDAADVTSVLSAPALPPGVDGQWQQLDLSFRGGSFSRGDMLGFGIDRDEADAVGPRNAIGGNSADLLGGGVLIPEGKRVWGGMSFFGSFEDGRQYHGRFWNWIGKGYSRLDGYGFINAERAVRLGKRGPWYHHYDDDGDDD